MSKQTAYFRESGRGPAVVCIHAGYGSSGQWRSLAQCLEDRFRVIACDMSGSGKSPPTPAGTQYTLNEEVSFLDPVFDAAGESFHLIGHSFGGAVALKAALRHHGRVQSLTLVEPTLFALLLANAPASAAAHEIRDHVERTSRLAEAGDREGAAEEFVDYWFRRGAWIEMREEVRADVRERMVLLRQRWNALLLDPITTAEVAGINIPVLYLTAEASNAPTHALAALLIATLPDVRAIHITGASHMAPLTDSDRVNRSIEAFLREVAELGS